MSKEEFIRNIKELGIDLDINQERQLEMYCDFLLEKNKTVNLTAIKDEESVYLKHFYDSILVIKNYNFKDNDSLIDIGTGAGFPGMVIKIIKPTLKLSLLDSNNKKITFLKELADKLKIKDIEFINQRAEEYVKNNREKYDVVIARAVSNLVVLSELCIPFVKENGYFIAMKGFVEEELKDSVEIIKLLGAKIEEIKKEILPIENSSRSIILIKKINKTSMEYPRRYDKILKNSLKKRVK